MCRRFCYILQRKKVGSEIKFQRKIPEGQVYMPRHIYLPSFFRSNVSLTPWIRCLKQSDWLPFGEQRGAHISTMDLVCQVYAEKSSNDSHADRIMRAESPSLSHLF